MARMGCTPGLDARRYINYIAAGLSICLALAAFGCAAHALAAFEADLHRVPAPWYQAAFGDMFDTRALKITCAVALAVMLHTVAQLVVQSFAARKVCRFRTQAPGADADDINSESRTVRRGPSSAGTEQIASQASSCPQPRSLRFYSQSSSRKL